MPKLLIRRLGRGALASAVAVAALSAATGPAYAGRTIHPKPPQSSTTVLNKDGEIASRVETTTSPEETGSKPITSSDATWTPPPCWYEPFTPEEFDALLLAKYYKAGADHSGTVYDYYYQIRSKMEAIHYHKGDKGSWLVLVRNENLPPGSAAPCSSTTSWQWTGPGTPPPPGPVITAKMLSDVAYGATKLSSRQVTLSPAAGNQKVNLATYVKFDHPINPVWATAQLKALNLAATVVAVPSALHIDAGTSNADPQSCNYSFTPSGATYQVDSSSAACNITYRKATTGGAPYTFKAQITWNVTWTPTATPQPGVGERMNDGYSTSEQAVAVQEIEAVVKPTS
ncbi:hypothetical protein C8250_020250 [Streptomyces sp. So13.3]|uniref:hypothetical protein n=1 Tax=unclassified Streptomyces TaxID=2593676 RepID=UPI001105BFBE|nr:MULTISPECIES: hypothetical protein [unclassified Streptomyces]MCZ4101521.1 hypothetical protein [Streptomyces sp. H39-C1]QNA73940.1 hypothetical protein C8250_020250 [Streptomyces sp. So13.3]